MTDVLIIGASRSPIGSFGGALKSVDAVELGTQVVEGLIKKAKVEKHMIDDVVIGNVFKEGLKGNPARQMAIKSQLPVATTASTIDMQCGSGLKAIEQSYYQLKGNASQCVLAGGIESMSNVPHLLLDSRWGKRLGAPKVVDALLYDGLECAIEGYHMGITAENLVKKYGLTREQQDEYALMSQNRALAAIRAGCFEKEIIPIQVMQKGKEQLVLKDEYPREVNIEKLQSLRPAFTEYGSVTAGNASGLNDGAAAVLLATEQFAEKNQLKGLAKIKAVASVGVQPAYMGIGPVPAILKVLDQIELTINDIDLFEINEAFAAQILAVNTELNIPLEKLNVNGGAIALGHPVGASGARIVVTLIHELKRQNKKLGVASLCVGGGQGVAIVIEVL